MLRDDSYWMSERLRARQLFARVLDASGGLNIQTMLYHFRPMQIDNSAALAINVKTFVQA
jgi:hypothetical protein